MLNFNYDKYVESPVVEKSKRKFLPKVKSEKVLGLTEIELEILRDMTEGKCVKEIAFNRNCSEKTIGWHKVKIQRILNISNLALLTRYALKNNITKL